MEPRYENVMKRHLNNISRQVGHPVTRYEYILSQNDLTNAWVQAHADLGYPLKKESYRDRYLIYNKKGLEAEINKIITALIVDNEKILINLIREDTTETVQDILNNINVINNQLVVNKTSSHRASFSNKVAIALGKAIVQASKKIVETITNSDNGRKNP